MKKLLSILAVVGISVSTTTMVVACGPKAGVQRFSNPIWTLQDKILLSLLNDTDSSLSNLTIAKRFSEIIAKDKDAVLKMLQDKVSKLSNEYFKNKQTNDKLQLSERENFYQNEMDEIASEIAQNQFYLKYTNNILTNPNTSKDEELSIGEGNFYILNPQDLLRNDNKEGEERIDSNKYFVYMNQLDANGVPTKTWTRWQYGGENDASNPNVLLPTIKQLENNSFIILKKSDNISLSDEMTIEDINVEANLFFKDSAGDPVDGADSYIYSKDGKNAFVMNGKTALEYRFQDYFTTQQEEITVGKDKNFFESLLTMSYLESSYYNISPNAETWSKQDAYLKINSNLAQTIQSWNKTDGYKSKLKMVWSFTFEDNATTRQAWDLIGPLVENDGSIKNPSRQTLKKIYNDLDTLVQKNSSNLGVDPFFNLNGYNGLVKVDGETVTSVDGNLMISDEAKTKIAKQTNGPSIFTRDDRGQGFPSGDEANKNKFEFIFVLPIYLIDLLNDRTSGFDHGQSTTAFVKTADITSDYKPATLYSSYGASTSLQGKTIHPTKLEYINNHLSTANNFYIYANDGVPYTLEELKKAYPGQIPDDKTIWQVVKDTNIEGLTIEGLQFMTKNSDETSAKPTIGNIGINQKVNLGNFNIPPNFDPERFEFTKEDGTLYVKVLDPTLVGTIFTGFSDFDLSFDDASKDGVITIQGNINDKNSEHQGKTYSYKVNMGPNASASEWYINDNNNNFHYYEEGISSLDISNLSTEKKTSLLREIEFITSKEAGVADTAAGTIFPLFLENDQILYKPLYDTLKKYLINEEGGTSD